MPENIYDIIIVGGGIAGLHMARKCVKDGAKVLILEKEPRLGGRIQTKYKQGPEHDLQYECGPARVSKHHHRALNLINEFKLNTSKIGPFKKHRHVNSNDGSVILKKDITSELIQKIVKESTKFTKKYLQSIPFHILCNKILGNEKTTDLQHMFGYDAEFTHCNAYDAIRMFKRDFQETGTYFVLVNGLSELIGALENDIKKSGLATFVNNCTVTKFEYNKMTNKGSIYSKGSGSGKTYTGRIIIWAIPKKPLSQIIGWNLIQKKLFDSVSPVSLHRIFCQFPHNTSSPSESNWMINVDRTTTNDAIRQFIPLSKERAFAQVSYSDSYYADFWKHYANISKAALSKELLIHLRIVFPEINNITAPKFIDSEYWPEGVHMWKPGANSDELSKKIQHIGAGVSPVPMYIIGEAYSMHQCWIEGSLETTDDVFRMLKNDKVYKEYISKN
jgi:protoporphyrinogen oxidase